MFFEAVGSKVKEKRVQRQLTRSDLAALIDVNPKTIYRIERGEVGERAIKRHAPLLEKKLKLNRGELTKTLRG